jgi:hypothetical protein
MNHPNITTLSDGRQVVVFDDDHGGNNVDVFLNVINAAGTGTAFAANVPLAVDNSAPLQRLPSIAAQGTNALIVYEDATGGSTATDTNIVARVFNGTSNTVGAVIQIANHSNFLATPDVAAIGDGRYAIVYGDASHVYSEIYNPATNSLTPEITIDTSPAFGEGGSPYCRDRRRRLCCDLERFLWAGARHQWLVGTRAPVRPLRQPIRGRVCRQHRDRQ